MLGQALPEKLECFIDHAVADLLRLRNDLAQVRKQGCATAHEELEEGLNAVAAPIRDHASQVVAAADVSYLAYRVTPEHLPELAAPLKEVTEQLSAWLGNRQPPG